MKKSHSISCYLLSVILVSVILVSVTGCRPRGVLSSKQMEDILVDMHTTDGILQEAGYSYGHDEAVRGYYLTLLEHHGVTQAQFDSSLVWYTANPTIFDKIYPKVIDRLQAQYDTYRTRMEQAEKSTQLSVGEWLQLCQKGYEIALMPQKSEKNTQKFAQFKKL